MLAVQQEGVFKACQFEGGADGGGEGGFGNHEYAPDSGKYGRDEGGEKAGRGSEARAEAGYGPAGGAGAFAVGEAGAGGAAGYGLLVVRKGPAVEGEGDGRLEQGAQFGGRTFVGVGVEGVVGGGRRRASRAVRCSCA